MNRPTTATEHACRRWCERTGRPLASMATALRECRPARRVKCRKEHSTDRARYWRWRDVVFVAEDELVLTVHLNERRIVK